MDAASLSSKLDVEREQTRELILDLCREIQSLERRVSALERQAAPLTSPPHPETVPVPDLNVSADTVPAAGRALLAIAGAYLLRALTELNVLPRPIGVAAGIAYAGVWLWIASRARTKFAAALNASTALIVLAPLLWEATVHLHAIPPWIAAVTLTAFAFAALVPGQSLIRAMVVPACAWIAIILLFGTEYMLPFAAVALAAGLAAEITETPTRWLAALAADCAILILAGLTGRSSGLPEGYAGVPIRAAVVASAMLPVIYVTLAIRRTVMQKRTFTIFGIAQTALAFTIGTGGVGFLTHAWAPVAVVALLSGVLSYVIAAHTSDRRNLYAYAGLGCILSAAATWLLVPFPLLTAIWPAMAIASFLLNPGKLGNWNAAAFLWLAALIAPHSLAGVVPAAAVIYAILIRRRGEPWSAFLIAGAAVYSITTTLFRDVQVAGVSTSILAVCSLGLAAAGARFGRRELVWMMYATMAAAGWLLLARDLQSEKNLPMVASLLLFGGTLVLLPRILKSVRR